LFTEIPREHFRRCFGWLLVAQSDKFTESPSVGRSAMHQLFGKFDAEVIENDTNGKLHHAERGLRVGFSTHL